MPNEHNKIIGLLNKSFDPTYINYRANFLLAVEHFRNLEYDLAEDIFINFRRRKIFSLDEQSYRVREYMKGEDGNALRYEGRIKDMYAKKGFISPEPFSERRLLPNSDKWQ